ncbi:hypothetical protein [Nonomuraea angiospora]
MKIPLAARYVGRLLTGPPDVSDEALVYDGKKTIFCDEILKIAVTDMRDSRTSPEIGVKLSGGSGQVRGVGPIG